VDDSRLVGQVESLSRHLPVQRAYWNSSGKSSFRTSFKPPSLDHHIIVGHNSLIRARVNLQETTVRVKLHSLHPLAPMLFQHLKEVHHSKSCVDLSTDGVNDDEPIAIRSHPQRGTV